LQDIKLVVAKGWVKGLAQSTWMKKMAVQGCWAQHCPGSAVGAKGFPVLGSFPNDVV